ncbi:hypothetical protein PRIPAC_70505 [Pristionchus pacificus]|uniref:Uncharacterized protein n=1 Tax=Pristionchus pacificus TaxID=54126 RepID=A0A2A6CFX2_PRIPA|nr:hypothetical protein PRIPAC_70505 [Pristionchus pacificus]|eukprot:PDM76990.1 hypothetical protein PRIPAC_42385 [Pristionchus pacificus]
MPSLSKSTGVTVKSWSFSEVSNGKGSADRVTANCKSKMRRLINSGMDMENQNDIITLLEATPLLKGLSFYLFDIFDSPTPQTPSKIDRITDYSHFEFEEDGVRAWKYRGGFLPNEDSASWDPFKIRQGERATFWHYDPKNIASRGVEEVEIDESAVNSDAATPTEGRDGLLFTCWCGASYVRHGDLLNHLDFGKHQSHPWKMTSIDLSLNYYKKCLENTVQVKSLIPLQDFIEKIFDHSIPPLPMGWALRGTKKNSPLPEKTKQFFLEKTKIGKRADAEEAYLRMVSDPAIPMEERLTREQIKRYITRLVATPVKKKVVVRGKRSADIEMDEDGDAIEWKIEERDDVGEWEMEPGCEDEEEGQMTLADEYSEFIRKNKKTILPDSF